jgi:hypothetical protein
MPSPFETLDGVLLPDYNVNYWSDDVVLYACELLEAFRPEDWVKLESEFLNRPAGWQGRLADCLSEFPLERVMVILLGILDSPDEKAARTAAVSLNAFKDQIEPSHFSEAQKGKIRAIAGNSPFNQMSLRDLLQRIGPA